MKAKSLETVLKLFIFSTLLVFFNTGCEKESNKEKFTEEGIKYEKFFDLAKGDTISKGTFRDKPYVSPEDEVTVLFSSEEYSSKASGSSSGVGYIYDLMCSVRNENTAPDEFDNGYWIKIPVDLNEGAGGKYIYLYYHKEPKSNLIHGNNDLLVDIKVRYSWANFLFPSHVNMKKLGMRFNPSGLWTDLNDGAGGYYIKLEGWTASKHQDYMTDMNEFPHPLKTDDPSFIKDICIISSDNSLSSYPGWTLIPTDLNMGAGGKYIYLCYKKEALVRK